MRLLMLDGEERWRWVAGDLEKFHDFADWKARSLGAPRDLM
jgi:hypothetical protein